MSGQNRNSLLHVRSVPEKALPVPHSIEKAPMAQFETNAILIPSDGRLPHLVRLMTSPVVHSRSILTAQPSHLPHPEIHMDYIAEGARKRAWEYQVCYITVQSASHN
jgi:hypothetical protein